jgi:hypothetical protein
MCSGSHSLVYTDSLILSLKSQLDNHSTCLRYSGNARRRSTPYAIRMPTHVLAGGLTVSLAVDAVVRGRP